MGKNWRLRTEIDKCYLERGKRKLTPVEEDRRTRQLWDKHLQSTDKANDLNGETASRASKVSTSSGTACGNDE